MSGPAAASAPTDQAPVPTVDNAAGTGASSLTEEKLASRVMLISIAIMGTLLGLYTSLQSSLVFGVVSAVLRNAPPSPFTELAVRASINLIAVGGLVGMVALLHPERRRGATVAVQVAGIAVVGGVFRAGLQAIAGVYDIGIEPSRAALLLEIGTTTIVSAVTLVGGLVQQRLWRRTVAAERVRFTAQGRVNELLRTLQDEELRVRRDISQTLHGSVQSAFVVLEARLNALTPRVQTAEAAELRAVTEELARLREGEIRALSGALYPADLERGVRAALTTILERVPPSVAVRSAISPASARLDEPDVDIATRVLVVRIVEEAVSNALRHGGATSIDVAVDVWRDRVVITVDNDGSVPPAEAAWSGLTRLRQYLELAHGRIDLSPGGSLQGARLRASFAL
jgi:signal transduction histidine kinase